MKHYPIQWRGRPGSIAHAFPKYGTIDFARCGALPDARDVNLRPGAGFCQVCWSKVGGHNLPPSRTRARRGPRTVEARQRRHWRYTVRQALMSVNEAAGLPALTNAELGMLVDAFTEGAAQA